MNRTPQHARLLQPETGRVCKIVTFYEDFAAAVCAAKKFDGISRVFSGNRQVRATSWSFELLGKSKLKALILDDVSHGDVLVVATRGDRELPGPIASWVKVCLAAVHANKPGLVALHDEELDEDGETVPLCASLKDIASRTGATFMCNRDLAQCMRHGTEEESNGDSGDVPHSAFESLEYAGDGIPRRWGIND